MSGSAIWATQSAVYSALKDDSTLEGLLGGTTGAPRVFDHVPDNQDFPFLVLATMSERPDDTMSVNVKRMTALIYVYSRYAGSKEIAQAMDRAAVVLDGAALTISGYTHIRTIHARTLATRENDGVTRRGELEFEIIARQV